MRALLLISALLVALAAASSLVTTSPPPMYLIGAAGRLFPQSPAGYVMATVDDVKSTSFTAAYASGGLPDNGETLPAAGWCAVIAVRGGVLSVGTLANPGFIAPYGANQQLQNTTQLVPPVWFGTLPTSANNYNGQFFAQLDSSFVASVHTMPMPSSIDGCDASAYFAVYIRAAFSVGGYGQDFPTPPAGAVLASIADLQSSAFVTQYNSGQLAEAAGSGSMNGCCVFSTSDGFLYIGRSAVIPYGSTQSHCGSATLTGPIWFGTEKGAIGLLNNTAVAEMKGRSDLPSMCSASTVDTWAIFKQHPSVTPPDLGDCLEVDLQVSWYVPNSVPPCLADRWRYILRFNQTYQSIAMSDFNSCGNSINAHNIDVNLYDDTHYTASTTGATNCPCANTIIFPAVPGSEMSTICNLPIQTYGFCEVLISSRKRLKCP